MADKIKVLLADDEEDIKTSIRIFLTTLGYEVDTAYDGLDAIDKAVSNKPDVMLLDIMMPLMDGINVCKKLKASPQTADIKIIMLSAATTKEFYLMAKEAGATDFIVKPFEYDTLKKAVEKAAEEKINKSL